MAAPARARRARAAPRGVSIGICARAEDGWARGAARTASLDVGTRWLGDGLEPRHLEREPLDGCARRAQLARERVVLLARALELLVELLVDGLRRRDGRAGGGRAVGGRRRRPREVPLALQLAPRKLELLLAARRVAELLRRDADLKRERRKLGGRLRAAQPLRRVDLEREALDALAVEHARALELQLGGLRALELGSSALERALRDPLVLGGRARGAGRAGRGLLQDDAVLLEEGELALGGVELRLPRAELLLQLADARLELALALGRRALRLVPRVGLEQGVLEPPQLLLQPPHVCVAERLGLARRLVDGVDRPLRPPALALDQLVARHLGALRPRALGRGGLVRRERAALRERDARLQVVALLLELVGLGLELAHALGQRWIVTSFSATGIAIDRCETGVAAALCADGDTATRRAAASAARATRTQPRAPPW